MRRLAILSATLALAALCATARAQISTAPGSSNQPIDITADQAEVVNSKCLTTWSGSAEAVQGDSRLRADVIRAFMKPKGVDAHGQPSCGATDHIEAEGNVFYVTPTQSARGDKAVYHADAQQIVMTGEVIVIQGKDVVTGDKLTINTATHQATMDAGGKRVQAVFYPNQQQPGANQPGGLPSLSTGH